MKTKVKKVNRTCDRLMFYRRIRSGFSLPELLVSSALGLIISLTVARAFVTTKEGFMLTLNSSQIQDNGRFAIEFITESVHLSGFRPVAIARDDAFPPKTGWDMGQFVRGVDGAGSLDSLIVRFYGHDDSFIKTCDGASVPAANLSAFNYVEQSFSLVSGNLVCSVNGATPMVVVEGVEKLDFLYGTDSDFDYRIDAYKTATEVEAAGAWSDVRSIKAYLIARSFDELNTSPSTRTYSIPDGDYVFSDNAMRDIFVTTVGVRNILNRVN